MSYNEAAGKTTLVESLAGSLSLNNRKVLLIDTNFHHNTLSQKYSAKDALKEFEPKGEISAVHQKIRTLAAQAEDEQVMILGCGNGDFTPEEVLPENNILLWLKNNNAGFDYILIDSAALAKGPDAKELIKYVDSVILLFAADQVLSNEDKKLVDFLKDRHINILGTVLNKVKSYSLDL